MSGAGPYPTRGTELLDIPQSLKLFARDFVRIPSRFHEKKKYTDVSMKDASNGETGTKWILAIFEFIQ
jgi:hypothetical protein